LGHTPKAQLDAHISALADCGIECNSSNNFLRNSDVNDASQKTVAYANALCNKWGTQIGFSCIPISPLNSTTFAEYTDNGILAVRNFFLHFLQCNVNRKFFDQSPPVAKSFHFNPNPAHRRPKRNGSPSPLRILGFRSVFTIQRSTIQAHHKLQYSSVHLPIDFKKSLHTDFFGVG
jgi:hypothetical protein